MFVGEDGDEDYINTMSNTWMSYIVIVLSNIILVTKK